LPRKRRTHVRKSATSPLPECLERAAPLPPPQLAAIRATTMSLRARLLAPPASAAAEAPPRSSRFNDAPPLYQFVSTSRIRCRLGINSPRLDRRRSMPLLFAGDVCIMYISGRNSHQVQAHGKPHLLRSLDDCNCSSSSGGGSSSSRRQNLSHVGKLS
jgi:hypothetical protein